MMNGWKTQKEAEEIRRRYQAGTRIELEYMDERDMPPGLKGIVDYVDDQGQLHMTWENGKSLALVPGVDDFRILPEQEEEPCEDDPENEEEMER